MLVSHPISLITLTSFLASALSVKRRRLFLHSYSRVLPMAKRNNDGATAMLSRPEPVPSGENVDANVCFHFEYCSLIMLIEIFFFLIFVCDSVD